MSEPDRCPTESVSDGRELPRVGVVVFTMGTRPEDLARGIRSILAQEDVVVDVVCVGNGWEYRHPPIRPFPTP